MACCAPVAAQTTDAFVGIPHVTFDYYPVAGEDAVAIRGAIDAARPTDAHDGERVDALTTWGMRWSWPRKGKACDLKAARVTFAATVRMPRLTGAAPVGWERYVAALERHEAGHARYAYAGRRRVLAAIRGATCATANAAAKAALAKLDAYGVTYDRETRHGMTQGAVFP